MLGVVGHASEVAWLNPTHVTSRISILKSAQESIQCHTDNQFIQQYQTISWPVTRQALFQGRIYHLQDLPRPRASTSKDALHLPTSDPHPTLQLARLVEPTAPAPPHRRNSLLRQNSPNLLPHKLRAAIDRLRLPQALDPLLRLETQQHRRERARNRQLRRERRNLAAMGGRRWQQSGGGAGGGFHERAGGRGWWRGE